MSNYGYLPEPQAPPKLASEDVVIAAPMSFAGSAARVRNVIERVRGGVAKTVSLTTALILLLIIWWALILCWYLIFGLWLVPYRIFRRGQRKRDVAALRHREFMTAVHSQQQPKDR